MLNLYSLSQGDSVANGGSSPTTPTQEALALKKALEWELSLDSRDMRSHAWYYSAIPRQRAEQMVEKEGDFLVRDCVSQPGNFVLTCRSNGSTLHFVINKVIKISSISTSGKAYSLLKLTKFSSFRLWFNVKRYTNEFNINLRMTHTTPYPI